MIFNVGPVHEPFVRIRAIVGRKAINLFRCRRQPSEIEMNAPGERDLVGCW